MGDVAKANEWSQKAMEIAPEDPATLYNVACLFSLTGQPDRCFEAFDTAVSNGFSNRRWLENDPDLNPVRDDPRYAALLARVSS
jgi:adenylate cyclase